MSGAYLRSGRPMSACSRQRWSRGHKTRGQGQGHKKTPRPRPRIAFPRTDTLEAKDRNARGQGQGHKRKCSPKKRSSQNFFGRSPKKKRFSQKFFGRSPKKKKKGFHKNFSGDLHKKKRFSQKFFRRSPQKNVVQKFFQALHKILTIQKLVLSSSRGQANFRGLEASRPRTSKCVLEAKDVLEDSTSGSRPKVRRLGYTNFQWQNSLGSSKIYSTIQHTCKRQRHKWAQVR